MSAVTLTNLIGSSVTVVSFLVNGSAIAPASSTPGSGQTLNNLSIQNQDTLVGRYDGGVSSSNFQTMVLSIMVNGSVYSVDMPSGSYFSGSEWHYPGSDSDVQFILNGYNEALVDIQIMLSYGKAGTTQYIGCDDTSKFLTPA